MKPRKTSKQPKASIRRPRMEVPGNPNPKREWVSPVAREMMTNHRSDRERANHG